MDSPAWPAHPCWHGLSPVLTRRSRSRAATSTGATGDRTIRADTSQQPIVDSFNECVAKGGRLRRWGQNSRRRRRTVHDVHGLRSWIDLPGVTGLAPGAVIGLPTGHGGSTLPQSGRRHCSSRSARPRGDLPTAAWPSSPKWSGRHPGRCHGATTGMRGPQTNPGTTSRLTLHTLKGPEPTPALRGFRERCG